jgi:hypothetical protein
VGFLPTFQSQPKKLHYYISFLVFQVTLFHNPLPKISNVYPFTDYSYKIQECCSNSLKLRATHTRMVWRRDINLVNTLVLCFTKGFYDELGKSRGPLLTPWPQDALGCVHITSDFSTLTIIVERGNSIHKIDKVFLFSYSVTTQYQYLVSNT